VSDWKVSLIATVRNEQASVASWLEAIAGQTRRPDQIVICDGGSTDGTLDELQRLSRRFLNLNLTVVAKAGANIAVGRNAAIANAAGTIIAVTDVGCRSDPEWLEELVKPFDRTLDESAPQFVAGSYRYRGESPFQKSAAAYLGRAWLSPRFRPSSRSVAFTKSAWASVGGYPEWLTLAAEDTLFNDMIYRRRDVRMHNAPGAIVHWDMRSTLGSFLRMIRRNAFGDAEAGLGRPAFLLTTARLLAGLFVLLVAGVELIFAPPSVTLGIVLLILGVGALAAFVWMRRLPPGASGSSFVLLKLLGGPNYALGYLNGLLRGRKPVRAPAP